MFRNFLNANAYCHGVRVSHHLNHKLCIRYVSTFLEFILHVPQPFAQISLKTGLQHLLYCVTFTNSNLKPIALKSNQLFRLAGDKAHSFRSFVYAVVLKFEQI